jgi:hypothetical protein
VISGWPAFFTRTPAFFPAFEVYGRLPTSLPGLVGEAIADPKLHRQDPERGWRRWLELLLGPRLSHPDYDSSREKDLIRAATRTDEGILLPALGTPDGLFT